MARTGVTETKMFYAIGVKSWSEIRTSGFKRAMDLFKNTPDKEK